MKILFVVDRFEIGGIISFTQTLVNFLSQKNSHVIIMGGKDPRKNFPFSRHFRFKNTKIITYPIWVKKLWLDDLSRTLNSFFAFIKIIRKNKIDLIIFNHSAPILGITLNPLSKNIPKVFHFHGAWDKEEKLAYVIPEQSLKIIKILRQLKQKLRLILFHSLEQYFLSRSDAIAVLSQSSKKLLLTHFKRINQKKISILPSGIDLNSIKPTKNKTILKQSLSLAPNTPILFNLCRFDKKKGIEHLLKAAHYLKHKFNLKFQFIIASPVESGWFYNYDVFRLYEKLNLQTSVHFIHGLDNQSKIKYYQASDLFVFSSIGYEAYPYVVMEAMAVGTPVIATPVGGIYDMLSPLANKLVAKSKTTKALVEKIKWFLRLPPAQRNQLSQKCYSLAKQNFNAKIQNKKIYEFYQKNISAHQ